MSAKLNDETGQYNGLPGSNVKGKDRVKLSVGITAIVFVFIPFTMLLVITLVLILSTSIEFLIFGSFVPYSVLVTSFFSNPMRSPKFCFSQIKLIVTIN